MLNQHSAYQTSYHQKPGFFVPKAIAAKPGANNILVILI